MVDNSLTTKQFENLLQSNHAIEVDKIIETYTNIITEAVEHTIGETNPTFRKKKIPGGMTIVNLQSKIKVL